MSSRSKGLTVDDAVNAMLLLMPRLVGMAKRLPMPPALAGLDLAPRHLTMLAHLEHYGPLTVNEIARRLVVEPTTVSLMVSDLDRAGVVDRSADPADGRRRIVRISRSYVAPVHEWLAGNATAWRDAMSRLDSAERETVVSTMLAFEAAVTDERNGSGSG